MNADDALRQIYIELKERLAALIADGLMNEDSERVADGTAYRLIVFDHEEGFANALRTGNFPAALRAINDAIRSLEERFGRYPGWDDARKGAYGYVLAFLYMAQAVCYMQMDSASRARDTSLPSALAIAECTPALRDYLRQLAWELQQRDGE